MMLIAILSGALTLGILLAASREPQARRVPVAARVSTPVKRHRS